MAGLAVLLLFFNCWFAANWNVRATHGIGGSRSESEKGVLDRKVDPGWCGGVELVPQLDEWVMT